MTGRYNALRYTETPSILVHQEDTKGNLKVWAVQGQRNSDLNWETIRRFVTKEEARDYAIGQAMAMRIDTVYYNGYGLKKWTESWEDYLNRVS